MNDIDDIEGMSNMSNMTNPVTGDFHTLANLIKDVRVAMMHTFRSGTNRAGSSAVHVRPMYTQKLDAEAFQGELWFFTDASSEKVADLETNPNVWLTYAAPEKNRYVAVFGSGRCERNPAKAEELWNVHAKGWWPEGPTSASLALIRVQTSSAEYWDGPSNASYMLSLLKAVATGQRVDAVADHGRVAR